MSLHFNDENEDCSIGFEKISDMYDRLKLEYKRNPYRYIVIAKYEDDDSVSIIQQGTVKEIIEQ